MTPLLEQFVSETRDLLQGISEQLLAVEKSDDKKTTLNELFRLVHTLKGNTGLFEFPDLTRVLHAGEDVMSEARENTGLWDQNLTDLLFDTMDFVGQFCDSIEESDGNPVADTKKAMALESSLRKYLESSDEEEKKAPAEKPAAKTPAKKTTRRSKTTASTAKKKTTSRKKSSRPELAADIALPPDALKVFDQKSLMTAWSQNPTDDSLWLVIYRPITECFFQGDDPLHTARTTPGVVAGSVTSECQGTEISDLDPYQCVSELYLISNATEEEVLEHFRYVPNQIETLALNTDDLLVIQGTEQSDAVDADILESLCDAVNQSDWSGARNIANAALELMNPALEAASALTWLNTIFAGSDGGVRDAAINIVQKLRYYLHQPAWEFDQVDTGPDQDSATDTDTDESHSEHTESTDSSGLDALDISEDDREALEHILRVQRRILDLNSDDAWSGGRVSAVTEVLHNCFYNLGMSDAVNELAALTNAAIEGDLKGLTHWLDEKLSGTDQAPEADHEPDDDDEDEDEDDQDEVVEEVEAIAADVDEERSEQPQAEPLPVEPAQPSAPSSKEDTDSKPVASIGTSRSVKVDQEKIDRLMNLIGEMIVAKNALPFLAKRAEEQHGLRDMAREIKEQYAVVNRIAEEMQDSIMQIRMMPFSFISMRFPRLVRDISRRLNKEVQLIIEGEDTEADKNIIESLAEPLIHIVRNSLDHGIEMPDVRTAAGKSAAGTLTIKASQEADRVLIEIHDDGKGIDPDVIREKAFEKGLIDDATRQRLTDREAVNLVLLPGFSTAEAVSDLSGRGVGMDAVRSAVEKVNGTMALDSEPGKGTRIRISLPMSIAVTRVMIVESDGQLMGVPMDQVLETVRVPRSEIYTVKHVQTTVLRDRIVPLKALNQLLALPSPQVINEEDEHAVLVARVGSDVIGLIVDDFRGSVDIIQKPMSGVLSGIQAYSGAALIGDGSVLMVLNLKEIL
ncbi:chemotaxis protein CheW [Thalassolituus sp.]|uniref:chemotaxis protein CheA n=1 Tax=Thalassolituus sp. TaxID=2030822 RepID=UPI003519343F